MPIMKNVNGFKLTNEFEEAIRKIIKEEIQAFVEVYQVETRMEYLVRKDMEEWERLNRNE